MKIPISVEKNIGKGVKWLIKSPFKLLFRVLGVKSFIIIALVAVIIALFYFGFGLGLGNGNGDNEGDGNTTSYTEETDSREETKDSNSETEAGSYSQREYILITVNGNEYWYQNSRMEIDELIDTINELEKEFIVQVKDDNASRNAYDELINKLKSEGVVYEQI